MLKFPIQIYPSILSGDFGSLSNEAVRLQEAGADGIHIDIMDGHFVPNLTLGPKAVAAIRKSTTLFLDVHLMIYNPFDYVEAFVRAGADRITFHFEATESVEDVIGFVRKCNKKVGLAFRPETSFSMIPKYISQCDQILIMTVSPGFGGQEFMPEMLEKIKMTREFCDKHGIRQGGAVNHSPSFPPFDIQVDGGINADTARQCIEAGANQLVSGNYLFHQAKLSEAIEKMRNG